MMHVWIIYKNYCFYYLNKYNNAISLHMRNVLLPISTIIAMDLCLHKAKKVVC